MANAFKSIAGIFTSPSFLSLLSFLSFLSAVSNVLFALPLPLHDTYALTAALTLTIALARLRL